MNIHKNGPLPVQKSHLFLLSLPSRLGPAIHHQCHFWWCLGCRIETPTWFRNGWYIQKRVYIYRDRYIYTYMLQTLRIAAAMVISSSKPDYFPPFPAFGASKLGFKGSTYPKSSGGNDTIHLWGPNFPTFRHQKLTSLVDVFPVELKNWVYILLFPLGYCSVPQGCIWIFQAPPHRTRYPSHPGRFQLHQAP